MFAFNLAKTYRQIHGIIRDNRNIEYSLLFIQRDISAYHDDSYGIKSGVYDIGEICLTGVEMRVTQGVMQDMGM